MREGHHRAIVVDLDAQRSRLVDRELDPHPVVARGAPLAHAPARPSTIIRAVILDAQATWSKPTSSKSVTWCTFFAQDVRKIVRSHIDQGKPLT
jgi:hypothetical protein